MKSDSGPYEALELLVVGSRARDKALEVEANMVSESGHFFLYYFWLFTSATQFISFSREFGTKV